MADLEFSKEGAGLALGMMAVALARGSDIDTAYAKVEAVFGGPRGIAMRAKQHWSSEELKQLARQALGE